MIVRLYLSAVWFLYLPMWVVFHKPCKKLIHYVKLVVCCSLGLFIRISYVGCYLLQI